MQGIKISGVHGSYFIHELLSWVTVCAGDLENKHCVCICKIGCMCSGEGNDLDCNLGGVMSNKLVAMTESLQQPSCSQDPLGIVRVPTNDAGSTAGLVPRGLRDDRGTPGRSPLPGAFSISLSLSDTLLWPHSCVINHIKMLASSLHEQN